MAAWPARAPQRGFRVAVSLSLGGASAHQEKGVVMRGTIGRHCRYWAIGGVGAVGGVGGVGKASPPPPGGQTQGLEKLPPPFCVLIWKTGLRQPCWETARARGSHA